MACLLFVLVSEIRVHSPTHIRPLNRENGNHFSIAKEAPMRGTLPRPSPGSSPTYTLYSVAFCLLEQTVRSLNDAEQPGLRES